MKFSVIIPTYNRPALLKEAVLCVQAQTYQNFEIIIVNDNPADRDRIDEQYGGQQKVTVLHHQSTKGGSATRNTGILSSNGNLIAFLDDDDIWLPEKLEKHLAAHKAQPAAGLVYSDCLYLYNSPLVGNHRTTYNTSHDPVADMAKARFCPATSSMVSIRRECVAACGLFDEQLESFQDWDYWFRIAHRFEFAYIPEVLVHFTQHLGDRTSQNEGKRQRGLRQICLKWQSQLDVASFSRYFTRNMYYKNSLNALLAGDEALALRESLKLLNKEVMGLKSVKSVFGLLWLSLLKKIG